MATPTNVSSQAIPSGSSCFILCDVVPVVNGLSARTPVMNLRPDLPVPMTVQPLGYGHDVPSLCVGYFDATLEFSSKGHASDNFTAAPDFVFPSTPAPYNGEIALAPLRRRGGTLHRHASLASKPRDFSNNLLSPVDGRKPVSSNGFDGGDGTVCNSLSKINDVTNDVTTPMCSYFKECIQSHRHGNRTTPANMLSPDFISHYAPHSSRYQSLQNTHIGRIVCFLPVCDGLSLPLTQLTFDHYPPESHLHEISTVCVSADAPWGGNDGVYGFLIIDDLKMINDVTIYNDIFDYCGEDFIAVSYTHLTLPTKRIV